MAKTGSCLCGNFKISFTGEPVFQGLCHCTNCNKCSGSAFSTNIGIPADALTITSGTPKTYEVKNSGSGKKIEAFFCPDCGTTMFTWAEANPGLRVIKVGVLDEEGAFAKYVPKIEVFTEKRPEWIQPVEGADQRLRQEGKIPVQDHSSVSSVS